MPRILAAAEWQLKKLIDWLFGQRGWFVIAIDDERVWSGFDEGTVLLQLEFWPVKYLFRLLMFLQSQNL